MDNRKKLHEILDIVIDGNGFGKRSRAETGTLPTLFMMFSGHIAKLTIQLHVDGWRPGEIPNKEFAFDCSQSITDDQIGALRAAIAESLSKKDFETLERDIALAEEELKRQKENISKMKSSLQALKRKEKSGCNS